MRTKLLTMILAACFLVTPKAQAQAVTDQIVGDLVTVGISAAATLTGNIPLAMASGVLSKYISTYGVMAIKSVLNNLKAQPPQDLGEINIYYVYLIHVKRNLYQTLINMRSNLEENSGLENTLREIEALESQIISECEQSCSVTGFDDSLVNFEFLNIALEAQQSFDIFEYLNEQEVKLNYQYLMLLYLDVIIIEQKLLEAQYNVLANQVVSLNKEIERNPYISNSEKEYRFQLAMNLVLRWEKRRDERRVILTTILKNPLEELEEENIDLQNEIDRYRDFAKGLVK